MRRILALMVLALLLIFTMGCESARASEQMVQKKVVMKNMAEQVDVCINADKTCEEMPIAMKGARNMSPALATRRFADVEMAEVRLSACSRTNATNKFAANQFAGNKKWRQPIKTGHFSFENMIA